MRVTVTSSPVAESSVVDTNHWLQGCLPPISVVIQPGVESEGVSERGPASAADNSRDLSINKSSRAKEGNGLTHAENEPLPSRDLNVMMRKELGVRARKVLHRVMSISEGHLWDNLVASDPLLGKRLSEGGPITSVNDLSRLRHDDFRLFRNCGEKTVREILRWLDKHGVSLGC